MYKIPRLFWLIRYVLYGLLGLRLPSGVVLLGRPLVLIGFRRIIFLGGATIFPLSRFEVFKGGNLTIGASVQIGQYCHITCAKHILIGSNVAIAGCVVVTDISHGTGPIETPPLLRPWRINSVVIEDNCFIGWGAVILPGTHLSKGCVVGANVRVSGYHPPGSVIR